MSIFSTIMDKIFHHPAAQAQAAAAPAPAPVQSAAPAAAPAQADPQAPAPAQPAAPAAPAQPVDVEAVLAQMASEKGGGGNYKTSIVDLLKLLDLDSSLEARKTLADELNVDAGAAGTAEQNEALIKAVWASLAANGGKVTAGLA